MTIIKVTLKVEDYVFKHIHHYRSGRKEEVETHTKSVIHNSVQIKASECDWACECRNNDSLKQHNDKVLLEIEDMVNNSYFSEYNLEKIKKLVQKNIYAQIQAILNDPEMEEESKYYNIRDIVNDDIDTIDPEKESKCMVENNNEDDEEKHIDLILTYPFVTEFAEISEEKEDGSDKIIRTYEATMHILNDFDHSLIFITMTKYENGMSCGCSPTTIDHQLPVQLTLTRPINRNNYLEYDIFNAYIKGSYSDKYEYNYDLSSK